MIPMKSYAQTQNPKSEIGGKAITGKSFAGGDNVMNSAPSASPPASSLEPQPSLAQSNAATQQEPTPSGQARKRSPQLCCCELQEAVTTMASLDALLAFGLMIWFLSTVSTPGQKYFWYSILGSASSAVFFLLSLLLILGAINRSKVLCWIFLVGNTLLFIGSVVTYFLRFFLIEAKPNWGIPFLLFIVLLYKIYESVCIFYFMYEDPPPPPVLQLKNMVVLTNAEGVVPVIYSPSGRYYNYTYGYGGPYGYYYGNALATGVALGAVTHGFYC